MNHLANVWVFSDNVERYAELMTGARQWGEKVYAIVQGNTDIDYVKALGADEIVILESHTDLQRVEKLCRNAGLVIRRPKWAAAHGGDQAL
ncbi:electron transfer flavoprotein subunit alpha [Salmonella sp. NCTC 11881]|nr:electron transfer flavoprotein subunit alpha [Salmonella sp. NCTC 11881]